MKKNFIFFIAFLFIISCGKKTGDEQNAQQNNQQNNQQNPAQIKNENRSSDLKITSTTFKEGGMIPKSCSCDGANSSPQLSWSGAPDGVKCFAIIADDPDAPMGTWVHWVIFNIPLDVTSLKENLPKDKTLDNGAVQGKNDFGKTGYDGPCPPGGTHRYFFKLYALDTMLENDGGMTKADFLKSARGHIVAQAELMGKYSR
ncbi:MAG: YbhB/YbcL family Raf kinase inhibitor-like protein [Ignavibacteria bacterium]